jgi:predicted metal-binding protein
VNIGIVACEKMMDRICLGCLKCLNSAKEGLGMFSDYEKADVLFITSCGDCPGFVVNKVGLMLREAKNYGAEIDVIHIGTCIISATKIGKCPINVDETKAKLEEKFKKKVVLGTHPYPP